MKFNFHCLILLVALETKQKKKKTTPKFYRLLLYLYEALLVKWLLTMEMEWENRVQTVHKAAS